jgi:hypothetical protein
MSDERLPFGDSRKGRVLAIDEVVCSQEGEVSGANRGESAKKTLANFAEL